MKLPKILIVDDTPDNIEVLSRSLSEYDVMYDRNGKDALERAAAVHPDVILLDIMMPEMDGYEVCRRLKADETLRDIPVIFITGLADEFDEVSGFEAGAADYITKPYKPQAVKHRIDLQLTLKQHYAGLMQANDELRDALEKVKQLSGLLPICMTCKKIRDDKGCWIQLESYISHHSNVLFSHSFCPECLALYEKQWHGEDAEST